jgi:N-carbamoyl-L-amino-acid hydrolase
MNKLAAAVKWQIPKSRMSKRKEAKSLILVRVFTLAGMLLTLGLPGYSLSPGGFDNGPMDKGRTLRVNSKRIEQRIIELAQFGGTPEGGVQRLAYSEADMRARKYIMSLMQEAGMKVHIDAPGNIIGRREGRNPGFPVLSTGSHIDTVPQGGKYDGAFGVIAAIECVQVLHENNILTDHPLEVVVFTNEELGLTGSSSMIEKMPAEALQAITRSGKTLQQGILDLGGDPEKLSEAIRHQGDIESFIETHIEQGGSLDSDKTDIGVVQGIVGQHWWEITIEGAANHAGTTPMDRRQDALLTAAHLIIAINRSLTGVPGRQVGTVGRIKAEPDAVNVIPGRVTMSLEIRDLEEEKIDAIFEEIEREAAAIEQKFSTKISFSVGGISTPVPLDKRMIEIISQSAAELGYSYTLMPSGANHDAKLIAGIAPTGMIFVPSVGGISHSPKEFTRPEDMAKGANVLLQSMLKIDHGALGSAQK